MTNYWCKKLRLIELLIFWGRSLFIPLTVYHDEHVATSAARKVLRFTQRYGMCRNFFPANLNFEQRDEDGYGLIYLANRMLTLCCERFLSRYAPDADERYRQMLKTYLRTHLEIQILFITYVEARIDGDGIQNNVIIVEPSPMHEMLSDFYASRNVSVKSIFNFTQVIRTWLVPFAYFGKLVLARFLPISISGSTELLRESVWIEYSDGERNDFGFWSKHINTNDFDVIYYLDRPDTPITKERTAKLEARRLKWIDAHVLPLFRLARVPLSKHAIQLLRLAFQAGTVPVWYEAFQLQERIWFCTFLAVYQKYQVKVLIQHQDRSWRQAVQAHAMESAGGIMIGFHWSNLPYCMDNFFLNSQHVYFVWGKSMYDSLQRKGHTARYILPSGIWLKATGDVNPPQLDELSPDLQFTLAVFDSDVAHGVLMSPMQTTESLASFFLCILDLLEANPQWGCVLKLKHKSISDYDSVLPGGKEIIKRVQLLANQRRLVELDSEISPVVAAQNADLAVCYALNSAGIVSGIYQCLAVHWDCAGQPNPFSEDPDQQIFFRTLADLSIAIKSAAAGNKSIGDFSKWIHHYNYFSDYQGDQRIGMFIQTYMEELNLTTSPENALLSAISRYKASYQISEYCFQ